jgi:N-acetylneuraminic acid mutarotase
MTLDKKIMRMSYILFFLATVNIFSQSWKVVGNMPSPVFGQRAVVKDSLIYILGGFSEHQGTDLSLIQVYNPRTNQWKEAGEMNAERYEFIAENYSDSSIIILGGIQKGNENSSLEIWNFKSSPYIYSQNINFNRIFATGQIDGNSLYIFGGISTSTDSGTDYLIEYNIPSAKITYSVNPNIDNLPNSQLSSAVLGKNIYLFGGTLIGVSKFIYVFNTSTHNFRRLGTRLLESRAGAETLSIDTNQVYIVGGFNETNTALSSVEIFKAENDTAYIENGPQLNVARRFFSAVKFGNSLYVFGGQGSDGQPVSQVEELQDVTALKTQPQNLVNTFELLNNYPNPFNPSTVITFKVAKGVQVSLDVYSILGRFVKRITSGYFNPGEYKYSWDGTNEHGTTVAGGVYICRLTSKDYVDSEKMLLLK